MSTDIADTGRSITEALGGFWQGVHEDPTFVPLDEFMADQYVKSLEDGDLDLSDLVLEGQPE